MKKLVSTLFIAALLLICSSGLYGAGSPEGLAALRAFEAQQNVEANAFNKKQADESALLTKKQADESALLTKKQADESALLTKKQADEKESLKNKLLAEAATFKKVAADESAAKNKELVAKYGENYRTTSPLSAPTARWVDNKDGTVTDTLSGLMWADRDNGNSVDFSRAKIYCESYKGGGKTGWRMPTIADLAGLYKSGAYGSIIKSTAGGVWSSETRAAARRDPRSPGEAAVVGFLNGVVLWHPQSNGGFFRALPVRTPQ